MAASKMPARQRMINMMYLVLTAMLAMNVSKEVLDAFAVLDADLVRSEHAHAQRSRVEYDAFADAAKKFPDRYGALNDHAQRVRCAADSLVAHIEHIKLKAMSEVEGRPHAELLGRDADGSDSLMALRYVEAKDDRDVLTHMMVGSEADKPIDGAGSAQDLKRRIGMFRDSLKALVAGRGPELEASLDALFTLEGARDASGTLNNWESLNFYEVPLAAGIAHLSKLQADIRSAENDMVKWLYRSATMGEVVMSDLASAVIPRSSVVMLGDTFAADVFLAAYDRKNKARIVLDGAGDLPLDPEGKGRIRLRTNTLGEQRLEGTIHYQTPKGVQTFPYGVTYQVMAPLLVASPTKMNVLYRGVENPLDLSVPGVTSDQLKPSIDNGSLYRKGDAWYAKVNTLGTAKVTVLATLPDGSSRSIGPVVFRVKDLPPPIASVNGATATDSKVKAGKLNVAEGVTVKRAEGCEFDERYNVKRFTLVYSKAGTFNEIDVSGNAFVGESRVIMQSLKGNELIWIQNIKAQLENGAGPEYTLSPLAFKVIR